MASPKESTARSAKLKLNLVTQFDQIYESLFPKVKGIIQGRCHNEAIAEEIAQEAFLKAYVNRERYEDRGFPVEAWIVRIAYNILSSRNRHEGRIVFLSDYEVEGEDSWIDSIEDGHDDLTLFQQDSEWEDLMSHLNPKQVEVMTLRFVLGYKNREIGERLGVPERTTTSRFHSALNILIPILRTKYKRDFERKVRKPGRGLHKKNTGTRRLYE